ncbi:ribosomal protein S18 [Alternaria alternata]|nr:ribosomal protein S18 [Alternaria alternata]
MSVMRLPLRPLPSAGRTSMRYFSSASKKQEDVLDILKTSSAGRHPSNTGAPFPSAASSSKSPSTPPSTSALSRFARGAGLDSTTPSRELAESERIAQYQRQIYRKWQPGDVYAPHDLSGTEQKKWKYGRKKPQQDAFDVLGINPVLEYKNFTMMSEYMTEMGRIKHSKDTGLRPKNQRKIAKAIRRAVGLGLMPSVHRHPLVLKKSSPTRFL